MALKTVELLPELPIDIVVDEILPRLPATSLIRFKCVNKFFRTLISSRKFIDLHLHQCLSSNTNRFLILGDNSIEQRLYWADLDSPITSIIKLPGQQDSTLRYCTYFVGSCNGLLCLAKSYFQVKEYIEDEDDDEIVIVNPCTGMIKSVIPAPFDGCLVRGFENLGFGYDSIKDDYKFVGFNAYFSYEINHHVLKVMVYSMRANSWHRCVTKTYTEYDAWDQLGVLYKPHLIHWIIFNKSDYSQRVGCFNLETEQWTCYEVPLPWTQCSMFLSVINGDLGLFTQDSFRRYLWIMKEYGVKESWYSFQIYEHFPLNNWTRMLYTKVVYRRETRKDELLVRIIREKVSKVEAKATEEVYYWFDITHQTYDRFKQIPPTFQVVDSSIGSLVSIVSGCKCSFNC